MNFHNRSLFLFLIALISIFTFGTCLLSIFFFYFGIYSPSTSTQQISPISTSTRPNQTSITIQDTPTSYAISPTISPTSVRIDESTSTQGAVIQDGWCVPWNSESTYAKVIEVIDGITIKVKIDDMNHIVRYIGIAIPEEDLAFNAGERSKNKNKSLVLGKKILLIRDKEDKDSEGNLLRYVIVDAIFVNHTMIESGFALVDSQPPNISCDTLFAYSEINAINRQIGLWLPESTATRTIPTKTPLSLSSGNVAITYISPEGKGWKQPDEFVEIKNQDDQIIQLKNWTLKDSDNHIYHFPPYTIIPGQYCRIYTNIYDPSTCGFSWNKYSGIWSDDGECAYLYDSFGSLISTLCNE
jgi:endonuclease YncB( thermonuclease family)